MFKTIIVKEATDKGRNIKIVDQDKLKFTLWKMDLRNDTPTPAFSAYQNTQGVGATLDIEYDEKPASFTGQDGKLVEYTDRTIRSIGKSSKEAVAQGSGVRGHVEAKKTEDRNWDKEAYEKCCSIWIAAMMTGKDNAHFIPPFDEFWHVFQSIRKDGEKRFSGKQEEQQSVTVSGADIPFGDEEPPVDVYENI